MHHHPLQRPGVYTSTQPFGQQPRAWGMYPQAHPQVQRLPIPARAASHTPPALYVVGSFALMMVLAAAMSVVGSVAALSLIDATEEAPSTETAQPAASLGGAD